MSEPIRDPDAVIHALTEAAVAFPNQRITQIISNALGDAIFYIEDDVAAKAIYHYIEQQGPRWGDL